MARSLKKTPFINPGVYKKVLKGKEIIKTRARSSVIFEQCVNKTFLVYNGQKYIPVFVTDIMIGHKLGEFSPTRICRHNVSAKSSSKGKKK